MRTVLVAALVALAAEASAGERAVDLPPELAPLRARLEKKVGRKLAVVCWVAPIPDLHHDNPCHLAADFDGDGKRDLALLVQERAGKRRKGVAAVSAAGAVRIAGAGTRTGAGGDNFDWMDAWKVAPGEKASAIQVEKTESASGLLVWTGRRLVWRQLGD